MPSADATCYYPDGSIANGLQPCINATNSDSDSHAGCCDLSTSVCTSTGYCFADTGYLSRAGCTDRKWDDPSCAAKCRDDNPSGFSNIYQCVAGHWDLNHTSCCGGNTQTTASCCEEKGASFSLLPGTPFGALEAVEAMLASSSSASSSATATASNSATAAAATATITASASACTTSSFGAGSNGGASGATVGAATGATLGALLVASLAVLALRERRWRRRLDEQQQRQLPYAPVGPQGFSGAFPKQPFVSSEADGRQLVEVGVNERRVFEMEGNGGGRVRW